MIKGPDGSTSAFSLRPLYNKNEVSFGYDIFISYLCTVNSEFYNRKWKIESM